jgi:integrase
MIGVREALPKAYRSSETFKHLWLTIKCWHSFWYVSDGYSVYRSFIEPEDHLVSKTYMNGLRTAELVALKWRCVDLSEGYLEVHRVKHGHNSLHPLRSPELRALRQLQRDYPDTPYVFVSERKAPLSTRSVRHVVARAGKLAGIEGRVHPHQLRHACGYYLATNGQDTRAIQDYLGHRNIQHTVRYTQLNPSRFESFWTD